MASLKKIGLESSRFSTQSTFPEETAKKSAWRRVSALTIEQPVFVKNLTQVQRNYE